MINNLYRIISMRSTLALNGFFWAATRDVERSSIFLERTLRFVLELKGRIHFLLCVLHNQELETIRVKLKKELLIYFSPFWRVGEMVECFELLWLV